MLLSKRMQHSQGEWIFCHLTQDCQPPIYNHSRHLERTAFVHAQGWELRRAEPSAGLALSSAFAWRSTPSRRERQSSRVRCWCRCRPTVPPRIETASPSPRRRGPACRASARRSARPPVTFTRSMTPTYHVAPLRARRRISSQDAKFSVRCPFRQIPRCPQRHLDRTDGLRFKTMRSRKASCRALGHPFEAQDSVGRKQEPCYMCDETVSSGVPTLARPQMPPSPEARTLTRVETVGTRLVRNQVVA